MRSIGPFVAAALLLSLGSSQAAAHQVWLEQDASGARLHFGEYGSNLKEASPGYLDKLKTPSAWLRSPSGKRDIEWVKHPRGLHLSATAGPGQSLVVEERTYPLLEGHGDKPTRTLWTPAARLVGSLQSQTALELTLDILPTQNKGEFQVFFRGQPLAKTDVTLTAASGWVLEATSDKLGKVKFELPWKGEYLVHTRHREEKPGSRKTAKGEEKYSASSFSTSLSFRTSAGLQSPPRPSPKAANVMSSSQSSSR